MQGLQEVRKHFGHRIKCVHVAEQQRRSSLLVRLDLTKRRGRTDRGREGADDGGEKGPKTFSSSSSCTPSLLFPFLSLSLSPLFQLFGPLVVVAFTIGLDAPRAASERRPHTERARADTQSLRSPDSTNLNKNQNKHITNVVLNFILQGIVYM